MTLECPICKSEKISPTIPGTIDRHLCYGCWNSFGETEKFSKEVFELLVFFYKQEESERKEKPINKLEVKK